VSKLIFGVLVGAIALVAFPGISKAGFIPNTNSCPAKGTFTNGGCMVPGETFVCGKVGRGSSAPQGYTSGPTDKQGNVWCVQRSAY
jgi:hypothetical protein